MTTSTDSGMREFYAAAERETLELKRRLMVELPRMTGGAELAGWRAQGRILAVSWEGEDVYPAFQFDDQKQPLAVMADVLMVLQREAGRSDWRNLFWFVCNNGWLGGPSPRECLSDRARVIDAAEMEVTPNVY